MHRLGNKYIFILGLGLASQVEAEPTAKSEDERAKQSESWGGPTEPTGRERPIQSSK
ncbi:secreted protein [Rhodopirellula sp. SWK7]|nr:secreted protein [Rhodopirellula sp. SWK7]